MDFAKIVFDFYSSEGLKSDLLEPEHEKGSDSVFQDAVAVLLALVGYSTVVLGKKKRRRGEIDKIHLISDYEAANIDIIAYRENNKLLFIECTTRAVDDTKIRKLQQTVNYLSSEEDRKYSKVFGLIFSSQDCRDIRCHYHEDINIVDSSRLRIILKSVLEGRIDEAREKLLV